MPALAPPPPGPAPPSADPTESRPQGRRRIAPCTGIAFELKRGERLRVIDPGGRQVSDLLCYPADDVREFLSCGRTFDYEETLLLTTGNFLWSNRSNKLMKIVADTCGRHDFLLTPCSPEMYRILYGLDDHPSCFANLAERLGPYGIEPDAIPGTFNCFMNVQFQPSGKISVETPLSEPGDAVEFEALVDLIVGLTACPSETTNGGSVGPIDFEITRPA
ncbi:DUF1989 domain-containing protein [Alienimonas chondri]|uniref:DUF1989 domain-containing protein n=1 Tax=Alienimonas chondri TaxID=2681879 RepID=A0ABX1VAI9_9PLAN|nr:urea carboxylase-associated family protein [Alienimonas chondri]NNJ24302.1 hypothetical protein [Alienimonas chondri]